MMKLKVFVDDMRIAPVGWLPVYSYNEAITLLQNPEIEITHLSLDHDLGENRKTGYDICKWMIENNVWPGHISFHSANPVGLDNMRQLVERYAPQTTRIL